MEKHGTRENTASQDLFFFFLMLCCLWAVGHTHHSVCLGLEDTCGTQAFPLMVWALGSSEASQQVPYYIPTTFDTSECPSQGQQEVRTTITITPEHRLRSCVIPFSSGGKLRIRES